MNDATLVCLNGTFIAREEAGVSTNDGAFLFGDTLFETFKAVGQKVLLQWQHLNRLERAATRLAIPFERNRIETALAQMAAGLTAPLSRLRLTLSRGPFNDLTWPAERHGYFLLTATPLQRADRRRTACRRQLCFGSESAG